MLVSGTAPVFADGSCPDDAGVQARRCLEIIAAALVEAGADLLVDGSVVGNGDQRPRMLLSGLSLGRRPGQRRRSPTRRPPRCGCLHAPDIPATHLTVVGQGLLEGGKAHLLAN